MENVSKALIIAASILVAIAVISLGVFIFMNVRNGTRGTQLTDEERNTFNGQFLAYVDNEMYGREVKTVIQKIISSNQNHDETKQISLRFGGSLYTQANDLSNISKRDIIENAIYQIEINFDRNGLIDIIEIK